MSKFICAVEIWVDRLSEGEHVVLAEYVQKAVLGMSGALDAEHISRGIKRVRVVTDIHGIMDTGLLNRRAMTRTTRRTCSRCGSTTHNVRRCKEVEIPIDVAPEEPSALTEREWGLVFYLRCQTKQGRMISEADQRLVDRAYASDRERYAAMEPRVFNATVPFGSTRRMPEEKGTP